MHMKKLGILLILPLAAAVLAGCPFDVSKKPTPPPPVVSYPEATSAGICLDNLRSAYIERNITEYRKLFASEYRFVFSPIDVVDPDNPTPREWLLEEELVSTQNMFESELVDRIELTFQKSDTTDSSNEYPGTWKVNLSEVQLRVYTRKDGEPLTLLVPQGTAVFYFRKNGLSSDGKDLWKIVRWEDAPGGLARSAPAFASR